MKNNWLKSNFNAFQGLDNTGLFGIDRVFMSYPLNAVDFAQGFFRVINLRT